LLAEYCKGWGSGVFALFLGFAFLKYCREKGVVRIRPLSPCPDRQDGGRGASIGFESKSSAKRADWIGKIAER